MQVFADQQQVFALSRVGYPGRFEALIEDVDNAVDIQFVGAGHAVAEKFQCTVHVFAQQPHGIDVPVCGAESDDALSETVKDLALPVRARFEIVCAFRCANIHRLCPWRLLCP